MPDLKKFVCYENEKLEKALRIINKNKKKFCIVLNKKTNKVVGTLTDGDIRRGLLKKISINVEVKKLMNKNFIFSYKKYIEEKLKKKLIKKKINFCPVVDKKKKIKDVLILNEYDNLNKNLKVFILAGGKGKRLLPLTKKLPKALIKVKKKPIIVHIINKLKRQGFRNFILSINYLGHKIKNFLGDGKKYGINIEYIEEKIPLGTAGSLSLIPKKILSDYMLILNCDLYTNLNFRYLFDFHLNKKIKATMCIKENIKKQEYGIVKTFNNKIINICEKPVVKYFINAGIYIINKELIKLIPKNKPYLMTDFFDVIIKKKIPHQVFPILEKWTDIGTFDDLKKIN